MKKVCVNVVEEEMRRLGAHPRVVRRVEREASFVEDVVAEPVVTAH
jgi:hypothetical protein